MSSHRNLRLPISTRHAFALAFDLAVRRDAAHSLLVPLLLRSPWILALAILPPLNKTDRPGQVMMLTLAALLGDFIMLLTVSAMLRFRARSVFNMPVEMPPAPVTECYALGVRRVPWLLVTEVARNFALLMATFFFFLPALLLGFRLAFATEAVVLHEPDTSRAFQRSFRLTEGRFERWLEMIVASVVLIFTIIISVAILSVVFQGPTPNAWVSVTLLLITAITPIIQYAWTFFYLRLVEIESPEPGVEVGPAYAAVPRQREALVHVERGAAGVPAIAEESGPAAFAAGSSASRLVEGSTAAGLSEDSRTQGLAEEEASRPFAENESTPRLTQSAPDPESAPAGHRV